MKNISIYDFYINNKTTKDFISLDSIRKYSYIKLERKHDYIQWIFPLTEKSNYNRNAPILTPSDIEILKNKEVFRNNMIDMLNIMLAFYGLKNFGDYIDKGSNFTKRKWNWINLFGVNHNYLRLTRIIKSLYLFGFTKQAKNLQSCLLKLSKEYHFPHKTIKYWIESIK